MQATVGKLGIAIAIAALVAGCGRSEHPQMMQLRSSSQGPDEFSILPTKPLQMPQNLSELPTPTPGGTNLTDPTPTADAITALGGKPGVRSSGADGSLITAAGRHGTDSGIRGELAADDLKYRQKHEGRLLERMFSLNTYFKAYTPMSLDQQAELERWRKAGVKTPAAPPPASE